jgi:DNA-binding transcriptional regulator PaaX
LEEHSLRNTLWRWLRARRFGLLQRSAWISPDPIGSMPKSLQQLRPGSRGFHVLETDSISGQAPAEAAEHCWDFAAVNKLYGQVLAVHDRGFELAGNPAAKPEAKRRWLAQERVAWQAAIFADPLLPRSMHPPGYLGPRAFARRQEVFAAMAGPMAD